MITLKTYGPMSRGNVRKLPENEYLLAIDFAAERYSLDGVAGLPFSDLLDYSRASLLRYLDPVKREWTAVGENEPLLYAPSGQRGLYLTGSLAAVAQESPTAAGSTTVAYASGHNNKVLPLICFGRDGAECSISGDIEFIDPDQTVARPYRPIFVRLIGGSLTVTYNEHVIAYKIPQQGWDEWPEATNLNGLAAGPITGLSAGALDVINANGPIIEFSGKYLPHASRYPLAQTQWALQFGDGTNSFGFYLNSGTNEWIVKSPLNSEILRPSSKSAAAPDLEFRLVWDKSQNLANIWANGNLVTEAVAVPAMANLTTLTFGKTESTSDLRATLKYFAVRTSDEVIVPWNS